MPWRLIAREGRVLAVLAGLTFIWVCVRAHVQSITIDEADTFLVWATRADPVQWVPASNNHILNSLLMRLSVAVFGVSHLAVRLPALLGAAIFLSGAVALCLTLHLKLPARLTLFALLVLNPFVLDYLVAARGYGMACGFLVWALYFLLRDLSPETSQTAHQDSRSRASRLGLSSCLALCFAANFSFAFACGALLALAVAQVRPLRWRPLLQLAAPGALITVFLSLYSAVRMPKEQLWYGARSLAQTIGSLRDSFFATPNPNLLNPWLLPAALQGQDILAAAALTGLAGSLILLIVFRRRTGGARQTQVWMVGSALAITIALHYIAYVWRGVLLPLERTGLFLAIFLVVIVSLAASVEVPSRLGAAWQRAFRFTLILTVVYVLCCMRLTWFREWQWNADTRRLYDATAWWAKRAGVSEVPATWHFIAALNFYNAMSGREDLVVRNREDMKTTPSPVYVLIRPGDDGLISERGLRIVWESPTDAVVAVDPALLSPTPPTAATRSADPAAAPGSPGV